MNGKHIFLFVNPKHMLKIGAPPDKFRGCSMFYLRNSTVLIVKCIPWCYKSLIENIILTFLTW